MRNRIIVLVIAFVVVAGFSFPALAQVPTPLRQNQFGGSTDHTGAIPSVPPPPGWKTCPRCQNRQDRTDATAKYNVEGHSFDPHDLSGMWGFLGVGDVFRNPPPLTPSGKQQHEATIGEKNADGEPLHSKDTSGYGGGSSIVCDPHGWPRLYRTNDGGFEFITLPDRVLQFFEVTHTWRTIWTDGRKLPENPPEPRWLGWNVGHWEGDTFVVESNGFDDRSWIYSSNPDGGWTHSDEMRVVERWRRLNYGTIESQLTVIDPKTYTEPWVTPKVTVSLVPGAELWEYFCVPSDHITFNKDVFIPVSGADKK
jgi:hypothetical protein